jgi:hypothetical protein
MKRIAMALVALAVAAPLSAQAGAMDADPTTEVAGSGGLPDGWMVRFDPVRVRPNRPTPPTPTVADVNFRVMGSGLHATSGPAGVYYKSGDEAIGEYTVSVRFAQAKSMGHEGYGIVFGGSNLQESTQNYVYFIVRPNDGAFLINHRSSDAAPTKLVGWETHEAVTAEDADGKASNALSVRVTSDAVHFVANGEEVSVLSRVELGDASTDGQIGLRINHNLDLHIAEFAIKH